jgi:ubiquinone/menaquinone biosynthesis C-methylase UbiE
MIGIVGDLLTERGGPAPGSNERATIEGALPRIPHSASNELHRLMGADGRRGPLVDERKWRLIGWYDRVAGAYDQHGLPLSARVADLAVRHAMILEGARVLDVGTGTGNVALAAARCVGARGRVVAVDLSFAMLQEARRRAGDLPVKFLEMDAETLAFSDGTFDVAVSSLLADPDVVQALREMHRVLRPGGRAVFASYTKQTHQPLAHMVADGAIRYHSAAAPTGYWTALSDSERFRLWFEKAGFEEIQVILEPHTFELRDAEDWWVYMRRSTRWGPTLERLPPPDLEELRADILAATERLRAEGGPEVDGSAVIGIGAQR